MYISWLSLLLLSFLCLVGIGVENSLFASTLNFSLQAEAAILMNAETGAILYEKNSQQLYPPASLTKIATALYTLQVAKDKLDVMIPAEQECVAWISAEMKKRSRYTHPSYFLEPGCSHMGIKRGEELSLKDLLYGMMVASADDASNVIAQYVGGTIPQFMEEVNGLLKQIGCTQTYYNNPHGLFHPKHQTTAYDLAIMTKEALKDPLFCQIVATTLYTRPKTNKQESSPLVQTNRLLRRGKHYYSKAIGVKTGWTTASQNTLVAAARQDGRTLIAVLLHHTDRAEMFDEAKEMFEAAFKQPKVERILLKPGLQRFAIKLSGARQPVQTYAKDELVVSYYPAEEPKLKSVVRWEVHQLPVKKDQKVAELHILNDKGELTHAVPLYSVEEVKKGWLSRLINFTKLLFSSSAWLLWTAVAVSIISWSWFYFKRRRSQT